MATVPWLMEKRRCKYTVAQSAAAVVWAQLSEEAKAPFIEKAAKDKARYKKEVKQLEDEGYFLLADGTKSIGDDPDYVDSGSGKKAKKSKSGRVKDLPSPAAALMALGKRRSDGTVVKRATDVAGS